MSGAAQEEVSVLSAIFCGPGECSVLSSSDLLGAEAIKQRSPTCGRPLLCVRGMLGVVVLLQLEVHRLETAALKENGMTVMIQTGAQSPAGPDIGLRLVFDLSATYPSCPPRLSVSSEDLTRAQCAALRERLLERARDRLSQPMMHHLITWAQQHGHSVIGNPAGDEGRPLSAMTDHDTWTTLIHLDHMRARNRYVKTLEKWATDLTLSGKLMFMGKKILILLRGPRSLIREFLVLLKTCKVDVDSSGKKCKERMMRVLCDMKSPPGHDRFPAFAVAEFSSVAELEEAFAGAGLSQVFTEHVRNLF